MDIDLFRIPETWAFNFNVVQFFAMATFSPYTIDIEEEISRVSMTKWFMMLNEEQKNKIEHFIWEFNDCIVSIENKRKKFLIEMEWAKREILAFIIKYDAIYGFWQLKLEVDWVIYTKTNPSTQQLFEQAQFRERAKENLFEMVYGKTTWNSTTWAYYTVMYKLNNYVRTQNILRKGIMSWAYYWSPHLTDYIINPIL